VPRLGRLAVGFKHALEGYMRKNALAPLSMIERVFSPRWFAEEHST
jgi:hypothetical protein